MAGRLGHFPILLGHFCLTLDPLNLIAQRIIALPALLIKIGLRAIFELGLQVSHTAMHIGCIKTGLFEATVLG